MSDQVGNLTVGFLMMRLNLSFLWQKLELDLNTVKYFNIRTTDRFAVNNTLKLMPPKDADGIANREVPDQIASLGAVSLTV